MHHNQMMPHSYHPSITGFKGNVTTALFLGSAGQAGPAVLMIPWIQKESVSSVQYIRPLYVVRNFYTHVSNVCAQTVVQYPWVSKTVTRNMMNRRLIILPQMQSNVMLAFHPHLMDQFFTHFLDRISKT